ncbi:MULTISPECIES: S1 family peptidase [unclassified Nocardiopsis]|uniref:S1 family peptidase n=1 Tax=unclassified Nocardiopsis TaxID=2649073 RepID=UPI0000683974|nr:MULTISPECIES: S1 family peptidase [unclassified Nocardiopsis]MBQ1080914.1 S1 family peptidase [Nocardiopsis sp. B62]
MRPSPVISAIGTGALAFGLALSVAPGASAVTAPTEPAPQGEAATMQEALERDFGLTPFEAEDLLEAQNDALGIDTAAAKAAGDAYAGSVFDTDTLELTVLLTDAGAVSDVEATGAGTELVSYGTEGLAEIMDELDAAGAQPGVVGWYPDLAGDTVVIEATDTSEAQSFVEAAGVDSSAVQVEQTDEAPQLYADIVGGDAYYMGGGRCSVGFAVTDSSGNDGFVTAGHCGTVGTSADSEDGSGSGVFEESIFPGNDAAFVSSTSNWTVTNLVNMYSSGGTQSVGGSSQAPVGAAVCRSGSTTGWHCGSIEARGQSVSYPEGTVTDMTRTDVCAEPGDSGGSFIADDQAQGMTSGGSGNCSSGGTTYYQEVGPALSTWNLSLVTS